MPTTGSRTSGAPRRGELWGNLSNLFDTAPPFGGGFGAGPTQPIFSDTIGRNYKVGF
jgi:hypothetical protein